MLLAVQRLQALSFGIPDSSTKCLRFFEPMRIPTITQQEHDLAVNRRTGKPYVHDSQEIKNARMSFKAHLSRHVPPEPFTGPLSLSVIWCFYDAEAHKDLEYKTTRPDTDNMIKMLQDEMAGLRFMKNDAQIAETRNIKVWSRKFEGVVVHLAELPKEAPECLIPKLLM
jgi:Holliday junction resolvase RusA-like endonuclease